MRLQRGAPVAGLDPELARDVARACHHDWADADGIARRVACDADTAAAAAEALAEAGFLQRRDEGGRPWWSTTVHGGALAGASFLAPISRRKADQLLDGVLERAAAYNADNRYLVWVTRIAVFGSLLDATQDTLGDIDLEIRTMMRTTETDALLAYARASGRSFSTFLDQLAWPQTELKQILRKRSGYISLHTEDVSRFTDTWKVMYEFATPSG